MSASIALNPSVRPTTLSHAAAAALAVTFRKFLACVKLYVLDPQELNSLPDKESNNHVEPCIT